MKLETHKINGKTAMFSYYTTRSFQMLPDEP